MARVAVTGFGAVTPIGNNLEDYWKSLMNKKVGINKITKFDASNFHTQLAAELKDFGINKEFSNFLKKERGINIRRLDDFVKYAIVASNEAMENAKHDSMDYNEYDKFSLFASGIGGITTICKEFEKYIFKQKSQEGKDVSDKMLAAKRISPTLISTIMANAAVGTISQMYGLKGETACITTACASSTHAIGNCYEKIKAFPHKYKMAVTGGSEASITEIGIGSFANAEATSRRNEDPETASRPFDKERDGFVMGEGAGAIVLENYKTAKKRKADIYGTIEGYCGTSDALNPTQPDPEAKSLSKAINCAIEEAGLKPADIADILYVNCHGTSTPLNDKTETKALRNVFGKYSEKLRISSTKGNTGHLLGATGAVEFIAMALALKYGTLPPTANYSNFDPECSLNIIPNNTLSAPEIIYGMKISAGFGGHNAVLLYKKNQI